MATALRPLQRMPGIGVSRRAWQPRAAVHPGTAKFRCVLCAHPTMGPLTAADKSASADGTVVVTIRDNWRGALPHGTELVGSPRGWE